jgi:hypothetical protein
MADPQHEAEWRAEFERIGESQVGSFINSGPMSEEKRQFGFRWLGEQAHARKLREERNLWYARWTFFAAVAAVIVGLIGIALSIVAIWLTLAQAG